MTITTKSCKSLEERAFNKQVGLSIAKMRKHRGMTQSALAEELNFRNPVNMCHIEKGKNTLSAYRMRQISDVLDMPFSYFYNPEFVDKLIYNE